MTEEKIKHIVRIANTDLKGHQSVYVALTKIKGIGYAFSNMVCRMANVDLNKKTGLLNTKEIEKLNEVIQNPHVHKVPGWMLNRKNDLQTGENVHLIGGNLQFTHEQDIRRLKKIKCYRGVRHMFGLPTRGQRTKSNFRRNKGKAVGVKKKAGAKAGKV